MSAMAIAINIVVNLAVVHNLAVSCVDPIQDACVSLLTVRPILRACGGAVCEGAVIPVNAGVAHANDLVLPSQACINMGGAMASHSTQSPPCCECDQHAARSEGDMFTSPTAEVSNYTLQLFSICIMFPALLCQLSESCPGCTMHKTGKPYSITDHADPAKPAYFDKSAS